MICLLIFIYLFIYLFIWERSRIMGRLKVLRQTAWAQNLDPSLTVEPGDGV